MPTISSPASPNNRAERSTGRTAFLVFAVATGFALLETAKAIVGTRIRGLPVGWLALLGQNLPWWWLWAALTPIVAWLGRRFPLIDRRTAPPRVLLHAGAAIVLSSAHIWLTAPPFYWMNRAMVGAPSALALVWSWHATYFMFDVVTYGMILGAFHWIDFQRLYRDELLVASRLTARTAELQRGLAVARIDALQKELNPHFLFNGLNAVAGLIRRGEPTAAIGMLTRLSDLLRATLAGGLPAEIPLADELALLDRYVAIETTRFADRLTVDVRVPRDLEHVAVPALLLQPVVENAIRYGVAREVGPGTVTIAGRRDAERLCLEVLDTGPGFPEDVLLEQRFGVGLSNLRSRLEHLYQVAGGLALSNRPEGGATVTIWIPIPG